MSGVLSFPDKQSMDDWLVAASGMTSDEIHDGSERIQRCRRRCEWRGVEIPEAEHCGPVQLCGTDRRALGEEMY